MNNAQDARVLGPAILLETHYRLLLSPMGKMLRQLVIADSHASRIAKAIQQLKTEFRSPLSVSELASTAGMSVSSFHQHFKSVTGTTPLQYLKDMRLIAAKAMLLNKSHTVSQVSYAIGYESPAHFSRDYRRKFGLPPSKDMGFDVVAALNSPAMETSRARARDLDS
jgi:transcriptional regulator GlxA family with amidase domain